MQNQKLEGGMNQTLDIQDFSIILAVRNHNPAILSLDFLKGSGVIPGEWELASPPVISAQAAQMIFTNGIKIEAQAGIISFFQGMDSHDLFKNIEIPNIARRYAAMLPNLDYQGVGINPRRFVTFENRADNAHQYLTQTLLSRGSWQDFGIAPLQVGMNLAYTLERCQLRLNINEVKLQFPDREAVSALLFAGNFTYGIAGVSAEERLQNLHQVLENWQSDVTTYQELIDSRFLAGGKDNIVTIRDAVSAFPVTVF